MESLAVQDFLEKEGTLRPDGTKETPTLQKFEVQIAKYRSIEEQVMAQPSSLIIRFLKVDARPLKQALVACLIKWIFLYTQCLQDKVSLLLSSLFVCTDRLEVS